MTAAPVTVGPQTSVAQVARAMRDRGLGAALVTVAPDDDLDHVVRLAVERDPEPALGVCATGHRGPVGQWLQKEDDAS